MESVDAKLMKQRCHGDMRIARDSVPQCKRAVGGELAYQPVGQGFDGVVFLFPDFGLSANGYDSPLNSRRCRFGCAVVAGFMCRMAVRPGAGGRFILGPDIAAVDA